MDNDELADALDAMRLALRSVAQRLEAIEKVVDATHNAAIYHSQRLRDIPLVPPRDIILHNFMSSLTNYMHDVSERLAKLETVSESTLKWWRR